MFLRHFWREAHIYPNLFGQRHLFVTHSQFAA